MEIQVYSQWKLEELAEQPFDTPTALISIGGVDSAPPALLHRPQHMLRLEFDDARRSSGAKHLFTPEQGKQIADFVYAHKDSVETLICQCLLGRSRSAAVAAAIREHFGLDGMELFIDGEHCPNLFVFSIVLNALEQRSQGGPNERTADQKHPDRLSEGNQP